MARVEAPSKPLAPNSTRADFSRASRISVRVRRTRTLSRDCVLRCIARSVPLLSIDNKGRKDLDMSATRENTKQGREGTSVRLLPLSKEPFQAPTDRDMLPSERREFVRTHRT